MPKKNTPDESKGTEAPAKGIVMNLSEARSKVKGKDKLGRKDIIRKIFKALAHDKYILPWPKFPHNLMVFEDERGTRMPVEILKGQVVRDRAGEAVQRLILQYAERLVLMFGPDLAITTSEAREIAGLWAANAEVISHDRIKPVRFKGERGYTWARLDFDPSPEETPFFDELMSRVQNRDYLMAWIGSLFIPEASRQNYLWLHGDGGQGKSSLARFLSELLGRAYRSEMVPDYSSKRFWTSGLVGSRLVVFPDCNEGSFVTTSLFKSCTGDDPVRIENKNEGVISLNLNCKFMFISNDDPTLSGSRANVRRLIYSEIAPLPEGKELIPPGIYRNHLWVERSGFIYKCMQMYRAIFPEHGDLSKAQMRDMHGLEEVIEESEALFSTIFEEWFELAPYDETKASNTDKATWPKVATSSIRAALDTYKTKKPIAKGFYRYLERLDPRIKKFKISGQRGYYGIRLRNQELDRDSF